MASHDVPGTPHAGIDFEHLFKLRLAVARVGEMDNARWWNTKGMLGRLGGLALKRGFPKTHRFAQARVVFAVAAARCREIFDPPNCITLWNLPAGIEAQFDAYWATWPGQGDRWAGLFLRLEAVQGTDLLSVVQDLELASPEEIEQARRLKRAAEGHAVPIPGVHSPNDQLLAQLALGFSRGEPGNPAIPYARLEV